MPSSPCAGLHDAALGLGRATQTFAGMLPRVRVYAPTAVVGTGACSAAHRVFQLTTYEERTKPEASTKECRGLMIISGVGRTYSIGASSGYWSGSHSSTGMLYFTSCVRTHRMPLHAGKLRKDCLG